MWFMTALFESMQNGAYLNKRYYIPREVWYQPGMKVSGLQAKREFLEALLPVIAKVQEAFASNAALDLKADLDPLQAKLSKGVSGIKSTTAAAKPAAAKYDGLSLIGWSWFPDSGCREDTISASGGKNFKNFFTSKAAVISNKIDTFKASCVPTLWLPFC